MMLSGLVKICRLFNRDNAAGVLMLCFVVMTVLYDYTEASFYAVTNIWLLAVLAVTEAPGRLWVQESEVIDEPTALSGRQAGSWKCLKAGSPQRANEVW